MPCFDYDPQPGSLVLPRANRRVPWHLVANPRITTLAHAGGWVSLYAAASGMIRLAGGAHPQSQWRIEGAGKIEPLEITATRFGASYAEWRAESPRVKVSRRVWLLPEGPGALRVDTRGTGDCDPVLIEDWPLKPYPLFIGGLMSHRVKASGKVPFLEKLLWDATLSLTSLSRTVTDIARTGAGVLMRYSYEECGGGIAAIPKVRPDPEGPALFDPRLPVVFMVPAGGDGSFTTPSRPRSLRLEATLAAGADLSIVVGLARDTGEIPQIVAELGDAELPDAAAWYRRSWSLAFENDSANNESDTRELRGIERESSWHAASLRNLEVADDYFEARYPAQASAYGFIHGLQGAPRDYALSTVPLTLVDPGGARDGLEVMMRMTRPNGAMHYAHTGRGQVISGGVHSYPSDLPIFLLWAVTEYVWATGDSAFLEHEIPFYPKERETASTVAKRIKLAFTYLRDHLGCEEHGMLRVGSGDWSDPISAMAPDRRAFHENGGSGFNTAFAAYALPRAAELVGGEIGDEMRRFASDLELAMEQAWNGRWFYRGWDGRGKPIGDKHLFLDGQVFCLIAGIGSKHQELSEAIKDRLMDPSKIGPTILDRPHKVRLGILPPGWDCNGGVWAAINALAAWGLSLADASLGWECLSKQTLRAHANAYPHIWYGIWSGPDAYNSWMGDKEGETFTQPATPMSEFPQPNSNAHAGPLLGLLRVLGIEASPEGLTVAERPGAERLPFDAWTLQTRLGSLTG